MKKILIATGNKGKLKDLNFFLKDLEIEILSLKDLNLIQDVKEDGKTYKENSEKKALYFAKLTSLPTIADDGGIEIDALGGKPGVDSKYWAKNEDAIIEKLKKIAENLSENNRRAVFRVVITLALPDGKVFSTEDKIEGIIVKNEYTKRIEGFPYRSFFYLPNIKKYYHENELTNDELRVYNHRYKAIQKIKEIIKKEIINA
ncbi:MAG TPA: non-canonical purine NTP pyrophosphatase [Patescibacteria group bacterium]|nr:non-canonical purine NTP pyrophosphatase [Patescibacteria group bacterium]